MKYIKPINELFKSPITTDYFVKNNDDFKTCYFTTKSGNNYRLDLYEVDEPNIGLVNHISFSSADVKNYEDENYTNLTNRGEMLEILNRIRYIIEDLVKSEDVVNNFCIGDSILDSKNNIYEYFLKMVIGEDKYTKEKVGGYDNEWGFIFKIKPRN